MNQSQTPVQQPADERLLRLPEVLTRIPVSPSTWWDGVKAGRFPAGVKLGPKLTVWRASTIDSLIRSL
ncbi:AlpA family phage regulatory protein [Comamonadaceae bacterium OTU4NAUVB1]|nr:AlpA family phage regulatory protein [Comamonadaceae bacterium OTU4NAUVB1]